MKLSITLIAAKTAAAVSRLLGNDGQALPGLVAERLDPHLSRKLAARLTHGVILVTGTNGKTTTTKLIAAMLEANGEEVLTNRTGSNLKRGITSALVAASNVRGRVSATIGLFEVDEASLRQVAPELQPRHIVVLNLFRDQLDRYGELDTTAAMIGQGIAATRARVYLNADDPLVASLAKFVSGGPECVSFFGIEKLPMQSVTAGQTAIDSDHCPVCHKRLEFSRVFYGHIGHYRCPEGHFARPRPLVSIVHVDKSNTAGSEFTLEVDGNRSDVRFPLPGTYNLYNALAALSLAHGVGIEISRASEVLASAQAAFGRVEKIQIEGRTLYLLLIKNPAGFTQVLETFLLGHEDASVLLAVNDLAADGRDVSWLWDVPLEVWAGDKPEVITAGIRATDMQLRLKYAGIEASVAEDFEAAISKLLKNTPEGGSAYILPTYTAMLAIRKALSKLVHIPGVDE